MIPVNRMRRRRKARAKHGRLGAGRVIAFALVVIVTILGVAGATAYQSVTAGLPGLDEIKPVALGQNSRILDRNGKVLGYITGVTNRTELPYAQSRRPYAMPPWPSRTSASTSTTGWTISACWVQRCATSPQAG